MLYIKMSGNVYWPACFFTELGLSRLSEVDFPRVMMV